MIDKRGVRILPAFLWLAFLLPGFLIGGPAGITALAQPGNGHSQASPPAAIEAPKRSVIRFITAKDYPPFNYEDEDGVLTGFNIDLARAVCLELDVTCNIEPRDWNELLEVVSRGEADAVVASIKVSPQSLKKVDFTDRYYFTPGRFIARKNFEKYKMTPEGLEGRSVAVVQGSAHEAFINRYFRDCKIVRFDRNYDARQALKEGKVDFMFGDGMGMMFWINGTQSTGCCEFRGGSFSDQHYFGDGIGIAVRKGDNELRLQMNKALATIRRSGRLEELFLRYFPMKIY